MTHWRDKTNKSHKKRHQKKGVMTRAQEREFFGHNFEVVNSSTSAAATLQVEDKLYNVTLYADRYGRITDIEGIPETNYDDVMYMLRGQQVELWKD